MQICQINTYKTLSSKHFKIYTHNIYFMKEMIIMLKNILKSTLKSLISLTKNLDSILPSIEIKDATTHKLFCNIIYVENEKAFFVCASNDFYCTASDNFPSDVEEKITIDSKYKYLDSVYRVSCVKFTNKTVEAILQSFNNVFFDYKNYCNKAVQKYFRLNEFEVNISVATTPTNYRRF